MDNFIAGVKDAASRYQAPEKVPDDCGSVPGTSAGDYTPTGSIPGGSHDSLDWSNLSSLAKKLGSAEQQHGSEGLDISKFTSFLGGGSGDQASPAQTAAQAGADPGVVNKLLKFYHQQTGKTFEQDGRPDGSFDELQQMAANQLGIDVPTPILKKMIKWKLESMF